MQSCDPQKQSKSPQRKSERERRTVSSKLPEESVCIMHKTKKGRTSMRERNVV